MGCMRALLGPAPHNILSPFSCFTEGVQEHSLNCSRESSARCHRASSTDSTWKLSLFCSTILRRALVSILQTLWHLDLWPHRWTYLSSVFFQMSQKLVGITFPLYVHYTQSGNTEQDCWDISKAHLQECPRRKIPQHSTSWKANLLPWIFYGLHWVWVSNISNWLVSRMRRNIPVPFII